MIATQMNFYKTMAIKSGLYGCETWVMISSTKADFRLPRRDYWDQGLE
jgi:hypothetical protein